ncbi:hypothetical protein FD723_40290 (plasmid) [Nostoc sp. C052]|uniref:hypothetical protein n=1 Tax=Nostoc sp. C052 TaxID=2576902 RepID=UPI0015C34EF1|nr:hypothetical protein [Nostoc sp. C052]QLE46454.1 hypothetical protein FD723_40290 [Nostoc sp. C052]
MNIKELVVGQQIGISYRESNYNTTAEIGIVAAVTPTGQVRLQDGRRFSPNGVEMGDMYIRKRLCSLERVQEIVAEQKRRELEKRQKKEAFNASPEGKQEQAVSAAVAGLIAALNQHDYYADVDGHMDVMESQIKRLVKEYVAEHPPIE